jgi:hypothetical protein
MNADLLFQKKEPMEIELFNLFFGKIKERMPKFIISHHSEDVNNSISYINKSVDDIKKQLALTNSDEFQEAFKKSFNDLVEKVNASIEHSPFLHELTPTWHELVDIKINYKNILSDLSDLIDAPNKQSTEVSLLVSEKVNATSLIPVGGQSEVWETKAKEELNTMFNEFNLRSIQIAQKPSWKEVYRWAKTTNKAIKEALTNIGMEPQHAGVNRCLNLSFNPGSCKQSKGNGKMFADENCNTMVLTAFPKHIQAVIFQHEYAHVLDNRAGVKLAQSQLPKEQVHSCIFLSQVEMERQLISSPYKFSQDEQLCEAQIWMSEAISDAVCGSSSETLKEHQKKCSDEFSRNLTENFILKCIGEPNWLKLYDSNKTALLNNKKIIEYVDSLAEDIYKVGVRTFFTSYWEKKENQEKFTQALVEIKSVVGSQMSENAQKNFQDNLPVMSWDFLNFMKKYYYSHTNSLRYFSKSKTAIAASQHSLKWISPYHTRTLEIFARSCEDLQRPLILSTHEYFIEKEKKVIETENFLNPTLNKNERKVFINTLHSLARALDMEVKKGVEDLPALKEVVINMAQTTYSSMSEKEELANMVLEKVTSRLKVHH